MKIIHVIESTATGSLAMASLLANGQAARGYSVMIIYSLRPETPSNILDFFDAKIQLINVQMVTFLDKIKAIFRIRNIVAKSKVNFVIMHSSFAGFLGRISLVNASNSILIYIPHCISFMRKDINRVQKYFFISQNKAKD